MLVCGAWVTGCGSGSSPDPALPAASSNGESSAVAGGEITVFAAASLKKAFTTLGRRFEQQNPGSAVRFSFAGSSDLVSQVLEGAPADVLATADTATMGKAVDGGVVSGQPVNFASNTLTIVVPPDNPAGIRTLSDLAAAGVAVVVCAPQVPCGAAAEKVEKSAGITVKPVSEESSVTDVLNKVSSGEADAGLVYVTDAKGAGATVRAIATPEAAAVKNTYPVALLAESARPAVAQHFVAFLTGPQGRQILQDVGFAAPN